MWCGYVERRPRGGWERGRTSCSDWAVSSQHIPTAEQRFYKSSPFIEWSTCHTPDAPRTVLVSGLPESEKLSDSVHLNPHHGIDPAQVWLPQQAFLVSPAQHSSPFPASHVFAIWLITLLSPFSFSPLLPWEGQETERCSIKDEELEVRCPRFQF